MIQVTLLCVGLHDPWHMARRCCRRHLPRMLLLHGTNDNSVPCEIAVEFGACLKVHPSVFPAP